MTRKCVSSQEAVQYILDLPSASEIFYVDDEFSEYQIDLDICNTNIINVKENKEEDIDNNNNDKDLEVRSNKSNEGQEVDDGGEEQNNNDEGKLRDQEDDKQR